ncbi:MAG: outer membrane beta-barrel protein [Candidatus Adiutrix sp.]|jgi:opacity protein-like surface antigen|nr:outer membrane beta-barrel protein [Candidatus Adiutrix sp.]
MKKSIWNYLALSLILALASAVPAAAQDLSSFYVTPKLMTSFQKGDMNGGSERSSVFGLGFAIGTDLSYASSLPIRAEIEYLYHGNETFSRPGQSHDISAHSFMGNAFYDFQTDSAFTPYAGGGLGLSLLKDKARISGSPDMSTNVSRWNLAWNLGGGVAWGLNENMALDFGYRYMDLGKTQKINAGQTYNVSLTAHEFSVGLRLMSF